MRSCARPAGGEPRRVNRGRDHLGQRGHHHGGYSLAPMGHGVCFPPRPAGEDLTDAARQRRPGGAAGRAPWRPLCVSATTSMPAVTPGPPFPCPAPGAERSVKVTACFWSDRLYGALARDHDARALVRAGAERAAGRCHLRHGLTDGLEAPTRRDVCGSVGGVRGQQSVRCNGEVPWILHILAAAAGQRLPAHSMPAAHCSAAQSRRPSRFTHRAPTPFLWSMRTHAGLRRRLHGQHRRLAGKSSLRAGGTTAAGRFPPCDRRAEPAVGPAVRPAQRADRRICRQRRVSVFVAVQRAGRGT